MTGIHSTWFVGAFIRQRCYLFSDKLRYVITPRFGAGDAADILYIVISPRRKSPRRRQEPSALVCERRNWVLNGFLYPRRSDGILYPDKTFVLSADLTGLYRSSPNTWARLREYKYTTPTTTTTSSSTPHRPPPSRPRHLPNVTSLEMEI